MRPDGTLVGTRWGPVSAIGSQPHRVHDDEVWAHTPTRPWGSRRLPQTLEAAGPRRTLFRELLRRSEGVPVAFSDGTTGGKRRVPTSAVTRIDTRTPRIEIAGTTEGRAS